jgi:hypothetical protein
MQVADAVVVEDTTGSHLDQAALKEEIRRDLFQEERILETEALVVEL